MDFEAKNVIYSSGVENLASDEMLEYVTHVYVRSGQLRLKYHGEPVILESGNCMIVRVQNLLTDIEPSHDFKGDIIYITPGFIEMSTPRNNYGIRGSLMLFMNPVMKLNPSEQSRCLRDFEEVKLRLQEDHSFKNDVVSSACQLLFLDFFNFHKRLYPGDEISFPNAQLMTKFLQLLMRGDYIKNREVSYYADILCVTPKYLSEVSKRVSGYGANYWINRFAIIEIQRRLRHSDATLVEISDEFNFSSTSYFSRFVQNHLGVSPGAYRS